MASKRIKGITITLNGDAKPLNNALKDVEKNASDIGKELREVEQLLKFNPNNTVALTQKQELLEQQIGATADKLEVLKNAEAEVQAQFEKGDIGAEQYRAFQREIEKTEDHLGNLKGRLAEVSTEQENLSTNTQRLETFFEATGSSIDDFADVLGNDLVNAIKNGRASADDIDKALEQIAKSSIGAEIEITDLKQSLDKVDDGDSIDNVTEDIKRMADSVEEAAPKIDKLEKITMFDAIQRGGEILGDASVKLREFGGSAIEAAGEARASEEQFNQVFGDTADTAIAKVNELGEKFGILPGRLKQPYAELTSMFKGLGVEGSEAMGMAETALTLASDAAAFYDKSLTDAQGSLNSFLKGNYEGGEAIGLFANETQMAAYAIKNNLIEATEEQQQFAEKSALAVEKAQQAYSKAVEKYGESSLEARSAQQKLNEELNKQANGPNLSSKWSKLTEAQKQNIRLKYAEEMQKQAGVTGQAARESEGYENVMGNLSRAQEEFMAKVGEPVLEIFLQAVQSLIPALQAVAEWFTNLSPGVQNFIAVLGIAVTVVGALASALMPLIAGVIAFGFSAMLPVIGVIAAAIGIITAIIFAIQNWSKATKWLESVWSGMTAFFGGILSSIGAWFSDLGSNVQKIWQNITTKAQGMGTSIKAVWSDIKTSVSTKFNEIKQGIIDKINAARDGVKSAIDKMKSFFNFEWSLPRIKLPHFKISGEFSLNPPRVPSFGVEWYRKGGILTKPTAFGMNGSSLMVGGEAGREAVIPLNRKTLAGIGHGIAESSALGADLTEIENMMFTMIQIMRTIQSKEFVASIDPYEMADATHDIHIEIDNRRNSTNRRVRGDRYQA